MILLIFIPLILGSIIGLAFVLMLLSRILFQPLDKPELMNRIAHTFAMGDHEKAILLLEDDNHPVSNLLTFAFNLTVTSRDELRDAFEYGTHEMERRLTYGTQTLAWLTIAVPLATLAVWATNFIGVSVVITQKLVWVLVIATLSEIVLWNVTLVYVKIKAKMITRCAREHFQFFSGLILEHRGDDSHLSGIVDETEDSVELSPKMREITEALSEKTRNSD